MVRHSKVVLSLLLVALLAGGCAQSLIQRGQRLAEEGQQQRAIDLFYQEIAVHPDNYRAWRELGIVFYKQGELDKAEDALQQSSAIQPDATTSLYLGLINESRNQLDDALASYKAALAMEPKGEAKEYIEAHLQALVAKKIKGEVDHALTNESKIDVASIPSNTIAVADFNADQLPTDLKPLARGLAEFTSSDLAKVKSLTVVDRLKLDVIQKELELSRQGLVDQATAPRVGKLLGSRHIVTANVMDIDNSGLRLDGVVVNTLDSSTTETPPAEAKLDKIFAMEKEFVFKVISDLGIQLTAAERDEIEKVPTESYLALLAYSRGLEDEQAGRLDQAEREYNTAAAHDPGFGAAKARAQTVSATIAMGGSSGAASTGQFAAAVTQFTGTPAGGSSGLEERLAGTVRGVINPGDIGNTDKPPTSPPVIPPGTATVTIEGDTDAH